jgi:hypothetical protein
MGKHFSAVTDSHTKTGELLGIVFEDQRPSGFPKRSQKAPTVVKQQNIVMGLAGLGTEDLCTGKGQQRFSSPWLPKSADTFTLKLLYNKRSAYVERPPPPSSKRMPHFGTYTCLGENRNLGLGPRRD